MVDVADAAERGSDAKTIISPNTSFGDIITNTCHKLTSPSSNCNTTDTI